jgi:hypothetical protein
VTSNEIVVELTANAIVRPELAVETKAQGREAGQGSLFSIMLLLAAAALVLRPQVRGALDPRRAAQRAVQPADALVSAQLAEVVESAQRRQGVWGRIAGLVSSAVEAIARGAQGAVAATDSGAGGERSSKAKRSRK